MPSSVHQDFVETAIDEIVEIGKRSHKSVDGKVPPPDAFSFRQTFEALGYFLSEYKKSSHDKADEVITSSPERMEVEGDKKTITARCTQSPGPKDVSPYISWLILVS